MTLPTTPAAVLHKVNKSFVYGITGSGAEVVSNRIAAVDPSFGIRCFADAAKVHCWDIFELGDPTVPASCRLRAIDAKMDERLPEPVKMDSYVERMRFVSGVEVRKLGWEAHTFRELCEHYAERYVRSADDRYWVRTLIQGATGKIVVPVGRFFEADELTDAGAFLVRVIQGEITEGPEIACHLTFRHDGTADEIDSIVTNLVSFADTYVSRRVLRP